MQNFSKPEELMSHLQDELNVNERFATRYILMQGRNTWKELVSKLVYQVDQVIRLSSLCSTNDVFPDTEKVLTLLRDTTNTNKTVLVLPVAECARLYPESGDLLRYLAQLSTDTVRRVYVPLLAADDIFNSQMENILRFKANLLPEFWTIKGEGESEVIVAPFGSENIHNFTVANGIKGYLELWEQGGGQKIWLVTSLASFLPFQQIRTDCRVRLYKSSYDFVSLNSGWDSMKEAWGDVTQWEWLAVNMHSGENFDKLAGRLLNVKDYNQNQLMALWDNLNDNERWLSWLWSKKRCQPETYLYSVMQNSNRFASFTQDIILGIFKVPTFTKNIHERKELLNNLQVSHMPYEFWNNVNELSNDIQRLSVLTDITHEERKRIVKCVKSLFEQSIEGYLWLEYLESSYPLLSWYLTSFDFDDKFLTEYFDVYRRARVKDTLDYDLVDKAKEAAQQQLIWNYQTRDNILNPLSKDAKIIWVDGLGLEWAGLLTQLLMEQGNLEVEVKVARANLPTTTEANKGWDSTDEIERGLDNIAHHYDFRFPDALINATEVIQKIANKANVQAQTNNTVIITSDHGLSRFGNMAGKVNGPMGSEIKRHGRYAEMTTYEYQSEKNNPWIHDDSKAIMLTHESFSGGGKARGEVHGGATLEECLVPIITVRRLGEVQAIAYELIDETVKLNYRGEGVLKIKSSGKVPSLSLKVKGQLFLGEQGSSNTWCFTLTGYSSGNYEGKLYSNYRIVEVFGFTVVKGIIEDDMGL